MANLALRNPQFKHILVSASAKSVECKLKIDNVLRYTLIKNLPSFLVPVSQTINFDIAELARDYLEIIYDASYIPQSVDIETELISYDDLNGTGNVVDAPATIIDKGFEAYGDFLDGANPEIPFDRSAPTFLIANDQPPTSLNTFTILAPNNRAGNIPNVTSLNGFVATSYTSTDTSVTTVDGVVCNIKRIDCTKYGDGNKIIFINKYGVQQDLWFFLKQTRSLARTNEGYKANTITYPTNSPATYSKTDAPNKVFNTQGKQSHTFSSGFYPEFANQFFEELLLSEYIWLERNISTNPSKGSIKVPVKVKTSSIEYKTSVNDRLIQYTIEFEEAFDYINNIR
tara:strand:+ start:8282 stop:9307 length:1026 start_codon:yes stop_codon:yes gene_type:complete